jgi:outer membrane usher protein
MFGRAFAQVNASHLAFGAEFAKASRPEGGPGLSRLFVAGSIGGVGGRWFAAQPVQDSFALISVPELPGVPIYANGWYAGKTNSAGEAVATNVASYYDNFISFSTRELPLDYVFKSAESVISPPARSGTLVAFDVRKNHAITGTLVEERDGERKPLEFREITLERDGMKVRSFTARRGEFYLEQVEPGRYVLRQETGTPCAANVDVPAEVGVMTDVGTVVCVPAAR